MQPQKFCIKIDEIIVQNLMHVASMLVLRPDDGSTEKKTTTPHLYILLSLSFHISFALFYVNQVVFFLALSVSLILSFNSLTVTFLPWLKLTVRKIKSLKIKPKSFFSPFLEEKSQNNSRFQYSIVIIRPLCVKQSTLVWGSTDKKQSIIRDESFSRNEESKIWWCVYRVWTRHSSPWTLNSYTL